VRRGLSCLLLTATLLHGGAVIADVFRDATFGRYPKINAWYVGVHLHRLVLNPNEKAIPGAIPTRWPQIGIGTIRLWDSGVQWADMARKPGEWNFDRFDTYVDAAKLNDADVLYTLGSTPRWASARPDERCPYGLGCSAEPVRFAHWEEYVRRVAQRYGSRLAAYELWNEPNFSDIARDKGHPGFYSGTLAQMVELARLARKVLDENSPKTPLCTPGFVNGMDRLEMFLAAGGKQYVQAICYHFYAESDAYFAQQLVDIRALMKRQGVEHLPLWNTETGVETVGPDAKILGIGARTHRESMERLVQMLILGAAAGVERYYHFAWDSDSMGVVTRTGEQLPGVAMLATVRNWLVDARMNGCSRADGVLVRCEGEREGARCVSAWAATNAARRVAIAPGFRVAAIQPMVGEAPAEVPATLRNGLTLLVGPTPVLLRLEPAANR